MARKPEIQYIGQFYTYGSEAKQPELKPIPGKTAPAAKPVQQKKIKVYVDPVALAGIVVAVAMVILMAVSTVQYVHAVEAYEAMEDYVMDLRDVNIALTHDYLTNIDWEYVESTAVAIGMIPAAEAEHMTVRITPPEPVQESGLWDDVQWFLDGLFA